MSGSRRKSTANAHASAPLRELLRALAEVYADADRIFSSWSCPASTECCRFGITGREPYVTSIEVAAIESALAALGGLRAKKRPSPVASPASSGGVSLPLVAEGRRCPMLTEEGRCSIYASRPLGCRTFFCDRAESGARVRHHEIRALVRRVQEIAVRHRFDGDRGRPLSRVFRPGAP